MKKTQDLMEQIIRLARITKRYSFRQSGNLGRIERLKILLLENEGIGSSELAELMDIRPSSLSEQLDKLVEAGEVTKVRAENDSRVVLAFLTELGRKNAMEAHEREKNMEDIYRECLTEEEEKTFMDLCAKLYSFMQERSGVTEKDYRGHKNRGNRYHGNHHDHGDVWG